MQTSYTDLNVGVIIGAVGFKTYDLNQARL